MGSSEIRAVSLSHVLKVTLQYCNVLVHFYLTFLTGGCLNVILVFAFGIPQAFEMPAGGVSTKPYGIEKCDNTCLLCGS